MEITYLIAGQKFEDSWAETFLSLGKNFFFLGQLQEKG